MHGLWRRRSTREQPGGATFTPQARDKGHLGEDTL